MECPKIDETKLQAVKEIIDEIDYFAVDKHCDEDSPELKDLAQKLQEVTGKKDLSIRPFIRYSSCISLETAAKMALLPIPQKRDLTDEEIKEIVLKIANVEFDEATIDYFLKVLKLETGLYNITDYIYYPELVGMDKEADMEEIIKKIIADKKAV